MAPNQLITEWSNYVSFSGFLDLTARLTDAAVLSTGEWVTSN
jgi:hypothetical protein